jgi:hypothetical protein
MLYQIKKKKKKKKKKMLYLEAMDAAWSKASASTWIGMLVSTLFEKAKTKFPLQSLATIANAGLVKLIVASQFNFSRPLSGPTQWTSFGMT